jgi:hypothetical protein
MIPLLRTSEATPMPRPLSVPLRQEIEHRHQQGIPLTQIAADLGIPYGTVRNIWRLSRRDDREGLAPDYRSCGRPVPPKTQELLHRACELKREHPAWGAPLIRLLLRPQAPESNLPSVRSLQRAFVRAGVHRSKRRRAATVIVPQAVHPHEIWQVDAVENVPLATGERICWLTVTDEVSGALLATAISPPPPVGTRLPARDPGDVSQGLHALGPPRPRARRQRLSLGLVPRPALRGSLVVNRTGGRTDLESCGPTHVQSQGRALQRSDSAVGRAADLHRPSAGGPNAGLGRPYPTRRVPGDSRSDPHRGVPPTPHTTTCLSPRPREDSLGSLPSGRFLSPGLLEAACRSQWHDLDLRALPRDRSGLGSSGSGGAVRCVRMVLGDLQSSWRGDQAVASKGTDPRADHGLGRQPPPVTMTNVIVQTFCRTVPCKPYVA